MNICNDTTPLPPVSIRSHFSGSPPLPSSPNHPPSANLIIKCPLIIILIYTNLGICQVEFLSNKMALASCFILLKTAENIRALSPQYLSLCRYQTTKITHHYASLNGTLNRCKQLMIKVRLHCNIFN